MEIANKDKNVLFVNYKEGIANIMQKIARLTNMELTSNDNEMFLQRSRYHSKDSKEIFAEKHPAEPVTVPI